MRFVDDHRTPFCLRERLAIGSNRFISSEDDISLKRSRCALVFVNWVIPVVFSREFATGLLADVRHHVRVRDPALRLALPVHNR